MSTHENGEPSAQKIEFIDNRFGGNEPVRVEWGMYKNGRPAILLVTQDDGSPWAAATVNFPEHDIPEDCVVLKTWAEGEGMDRLLIANGVIAPGVVKTIKSGFVEAPVFRLAMEPTLEAGEPKSKPRGMRP